MKFYSYKYKLRVEPEKAFKYFLQKDYLVKFFSQKEKDQIEIISEKSGGEISEGEVVKLLFKDRELNIVMSLQVEEVKKNELIHWNLYLNEIEEMNSDEKYSSFMNKIFGQGIEYRISFTSQHDVLIINEQGEIFVNGLWSKIFWKCSGIYYRIKQGRTHRQVKKELERI